MSIKIADPGTRRRDVLFGTGVNRVNVAKLSKAIGIAESTLRGWLKDPWKITLEGAICIARARGLDDREILLLFK